MLTSLKVKNLALIESVEIEFGSGLNILTGETGAGKSILLGAINLLLGGRASGEDIRTGKQTASVEGVFELSKKLITKLEEYGITSEDGNLFIRREIHLEGKNKIFINGSSYPLSVLVNIGNALIDVHGQHQHQTLLNSESQLEIIDAFGEIIPLKTEYQKKYEYWVKVNTQFKQLLKKEHNLKEKSEFLEFRIKEISDASIELGDDEKLEDELKILESSQKRLELVSNILSHLSESENSAVSILRECSKNSDRLASIDSSTEKYAKIIESAFIEVQEASTAFETYGNSIEQNYDRIEEINERLSLLSRLKKKYGGTLEKVLDTFFVSQKELEQISYMDEEKKTMQQKVENAFSELSVAADKLSCGRKKLIKGFNLDVTKILKTLGIKSAKFEVSILNVLSDNGLFIDKKRYEFDNTGIDKVEMLISTNLGEPLKRIAKIASGGEIARIMLAIKSVMAGVDKIPTLIFDEIDSGIGGLVAKKIGTALKKLSSTHQILCVTHLPQIAAKADNHFIVNKKTQNNRTRTIIEPLKEEQRVSELARMMGDTKEKTIEYANELIKD